jgi:hypothetical protein
MKVVINYPTDKESIEILDEKIAEFKAILVFESIFLI